uniref:Uncharacterized protein n=1 Tax=viral metagenome TaxID=1070528 RepID=A0A6C0JH67_9ZZZZ
MYLNTGLLIIINIIISIIIIYAGHLLWNYLKDNYSKKKTKDLVGSQIEKYKKMVGEMNDGSSSRRNMDELSQEDLAKMERELSSFMENG